MPTSANTRINLSILHQRLFVLALTICALLVMAAGDGDKSKSEKSAPPSIHQQILTASDLALKTVRSAIANSDGSAFASVFTSDAKIVTPKGQSVSGRTSIYFAATIILKTYDGFQLSVTRDSVKVVKNTGIEHGSYVLRQAGEKEGDPAVTYTGTYSLTWKKEEGAWKISHAVGMR